MPSGWRVTRTSPGSVADPSGLAGAEWWPVDGPVTAAAACLSVGRPDLAAAVDDFDWWWQFESEEVGYLLFDGMATITDVWFSSPEHGADNEHLGHAESMFDRRWLLVLRGSVVTLRCVSLTEALKVKRPRPRWKAGLVADQRLRWFRTSLTGRMPGYLDGYPVVGPWREPHWIPGGRQPGVVRSTVSARLDGHDGVVSVLARVLQLPRREPVFVRVGGNRAEASVAADPGPDVSVALEVRAEVRLRDPDLWWPLGYGEQPLLDVSLEVGEHVLPLGRVGFRTVEADRTGDRFALQVNGVPVFVRGACWSPLRVDGSARGREEVLASLSRLKAAGLNLIRVPGTTVWAGREVAEVCDELGLLLWQDVPLAAMDTPSDPGFVAALGDEVTAELGAMAGSPSLAVVCGGAEIEQAAAMQGLLLSPQDFPVQYEALPAVVPDGVVYVPGSPSGGVPAFRVDTGIAQYFGTGAYRRPLSDLRRSAVSFAAECFALSVPPARASAGDVASPWWQAGVPRDRGADWDFAEVSRFYAQSFYGDDSLDAQSAAAADIFEALMAEWRRPGSGCGGAITILAEDVVPGPGWGLVDSDGRPKSSWWSARHAAAPVALLHTDEGLNGLSLHVVNDGPIPFEGSLRLEVYDGGRLAVDGSVPVVVPAHGAVTVTDVEVLGGFRDITHAYRFGAPLGDVVGGRLLDTAGAVVARTTYLPSGRARGVADPGLAGELRRTGDGCEIALRSTLFAQYVVVELDAGEVSDNWFHLLPGEERRLSVVDTDRVAGGTVRALNAARVPLTVVR